MMEVSKQTLNWIATSQAPRNDGGWAAASPAHAFLVIASEAWQSMFVSPQTSALGAGGLVCNGVLA
jgi:hypothetical protein